jgi:hypothetical protein
MFKCKISNKEIKRKCGTVNYSFLPVITEATGVFTEGLKGCP